METKMKKIQLGDSESMSQDIVAHNIEQLRGLFPEAWTEGKLDLDVLKQLLGSVVDEREEKYGLNWHGKRNARRLALSPSLGTLRPCPGESVDWDTTQNLMIEGDNLEVLKLLQKSYTGKVKMIYIDPPYNTGKDFVYKDDFRDNIRNYQMLTGQIDSDGRKMSSNPESSGRYHTDWLNMIYPRIKLARNLLREDGLIFISIDDHEVDSLRRVCAEIFGEENFIAQFIWNTEGHTDNQFDVKVNHEYVLLFGRNSSVSKIGYVVDPNTREESNLWRGFAENSITKNGPGNPPSEIILPAGFPCAVSEIDLAPSEVSEVFFDEVKKHTYITRELTDSHSVVYPIRLGRMQVRDARLVTDCRVFSGWANANKLRAFIANGFQPIDDDGDKLSFYLSERGVIYYRRERQRARNILSVLRNLSTTERMRSELEEMGIPFQYPKPKELLRYLIRIGAETSGIILDFFAGSASIAHAVWLQAVEDSVPRRFIAVQLPEPFDENDEKQRIAIQFCDKLERPRNLAEMTKERLRKTSQKIRLENPLLTGDTGFRVFKLDSSNIDSWDPDSNGLDQTLLSSIEHIKPDRNEEDVLYELLLKLGLDLCVPIEQQTIAKKVVYSVGAGALFVCLDPKISRDEAEPLALGIVQWHKQLNPAAESSIVFRDSGFEDDVTKTNITAILQQHGLGNVRSL
jgi:adenine-specific DNA-methyltransferase